MAKEKWLIVKYSWLGRKNVCIQQSGKCVYNVLRKIKLYKMYNSSPKNRKGNDQIHL